MEDKMKKKSECSMKYYTQDPMGSKRYYGEQHWIFMPTDLKFYVKWANSWKSIVSVFTLETVNECGPIVNDLGPVLIRLKFCSYIAPKPSRSRWLHWWVLSNISARSNSSFIGTFQENWITVCFLTQPVTWTLIILAPKVDRHYMTRKTYISIHPGNKYSNP